MKALLRSALVSFAVLTGITGVLYPAAVTLIAQLLFPSQSGGSLLHDGDLVVGSALVGQPFADARYFWGRPSATASFPYDAAASSGSNQGPSNPSLHAAVRSRIETLRSVDPGTAVAIPVDLVTASGSGLDPHVSPAAALHQVSRVARARGLPEARVREFVEARIEGRTFGLLGEPRVAVLPLNLALDRATAHGSGE